MKTLCAQCGRRGVLGTSDKCGPCHREAKAKTPKVHGDLTPTLQASVTLLTRLTQLEARVKVLESKLAPAPPAAVWPPPTEKRMPTSGGHSHPLTRAKRVPDESTSTMTPHGPACMCLACRAGR